MKSSRDLLAVRIPLLAWLVGCILVVYAKGNLSIALLDVWVVSALPVFLLAVAAALVVSCGQIDISTGGVMSVIGMLILLIFGFPSDSFLSIAFAHFLTFSCVLLIYWMYARAASRGISTLIVTLSVLLASRGASTLIQTCLQGAGELCRGSSRPMTGAPILPPSYVLDWMGTAAFAVFVYASVVIALLFWRHRTRWGLEHIAVGMDKKAARYCHISVNKIYLLAFMSAGLLVYAATIIRFHGQGNGGWSANTGWGEELLAIAIAVIGGTRITGGRLDPVAVLLAGFSVYISRDLITNDLGVPSEVASIFFGLLLLAIAWFDLSARRQRKEAGI